MQIIEGNLLDIRKGVIIHQVNCRGAFGAGVAKQIRDKYPVVYDAYQAFLAKHGATRAFGRASAIRVSDDLCIVNAFSQLDYGNPRRTHRVYTDVDALASIIRRTCARFPDEDIYIPWGIGAGYGGADWDDIVSRIEHLGVTAVKLLAKN